MSLKACPKLDIKEEYESPGSLMARGRALRNKMIYDLLVRIMLGAKLFLTKISLFGKERGTGQFNIDDDHSPEEIN